MSKKRIKGNEKRYRQEEEFKPTPGYVIPQLSDETLENMSELDYLDPKKVKFPKKAELDT